MDFREMTADDIIRYNHCLTGFETNSESSFANMYAWRKTMNTKICFDDKNCYFTYTKRNGKRACCFPRGKDQLSGIKKLYDYFKSEGIEMIMESVTEDETELIRTNFKNVTIEDDPDLYDYVYTGSKMRTLSGKKLHSKRNHINKFKSLYEDFRYIDINNSNVYECLEFSDGWLMNKWGDRESKNYKDEYNSIKEFLLNFDKFNLSGGIIVYEDRIIAMTIGEKLNDNTCVIHVEKADTDFDGAYTMINNLYINNKWQDIEYVNREEDMGLEGIRKAKKSYYPDIMIKKYTIIFE